MVVELGLHVRKHTLVTLEGRVLVLDGFVELGVQVLNFFGRLLDILFIARQFILEIDRFEPFLHFLKFPKPLFVLLDLLF